MKSLLEMLRTRRMVSAYVLLATLTVAIVAGSFAAHGVKGQEQQNSSVDAAPLKIVPTTIAPNEYVKIARIVGPAVVNINTQTLPKESANKGRQFHGRALPQNPDDGQGEDQGARAGTGSGTGTRRR